MPIEDKSKSALHFGGFVVFISFNSTFLCTSKDNISAAVLFPSKIHDNKFDVASGVSCISIVIDSPNVLQNVLSSSPLIAFFS